MSDNKNRTRKKKRSAGKRALKSLGRFLIVLLETLLLLAVALYGAMDILANGPSPTAKADFVMSVRETSAIGFLAKLFFTDEEIAEIEANRDKGDYVETDTSLITMNNSHDTQSDPNAGPQPDAWGLVDEDGDGIILEKVTGEGYTGYMMVVLDASRVIMGSHPESYGGRGYTVEEMVQSFDGVAGINAGGFYDPDGTGDGSIPDSLVVFDGELHYEKLGTRRGFVGFDDQYYMHVGVMTAEDVKAANIQYGASFGPVLIANGEPADPETISSGLNPRTAIGQRADGAVLLLVVDGRQATSIGARYTDLVDIMLAYGAVNALNLDGGSSSLMWYDGDYVNNKASIIGIRPIPTSFVVLKEGARTNGE